jgi:hypothetical protein
LKNHRDSAQGIEMNDNEKSHIEALAREILAEKDYTKKYPYIEASVLAIANYLRVSVIEIKLNNIIHRDYFQRPNKSFFTCSDAYEIVLAIEKHLNLILPDNVLQQIGNIHKKSIRDWLSDIIKGAKATGKMSKARRTGSGRTL